MKTFAMLLAALALGTNQQTAHYGSLAVALTTQLCQSRGESATVTTELTPHGELTEAVADLRQEKVTLNGLVPGRYSVTIVSGRCTARFITAVFPDLKRNVVAAFQTANASGAPDIYVVPYDALALELPYDSLTVGASMDDGTSLPVQVVGSIAFIDDIPKGVVYVKVSGANFQIKTRYKSSGQNHVSVHQIEARADALIPSDL